MDACDYKEKSPSHDGYDAFILSLKLLMFYDDITVVAKLLALQSTYVTYSYMRPESNKL